MRTKKEANFSSSLFLRRKDYMKFYNIKEDYIRFLKQYDKKVADNKNGQRPYVGIVLEVNGIKYYTPFTSPKPKHKNMKNSKDFRKINQGVYGAINFNNMIPVVDEAVKLIDIDNIDDSQYKRLLQNQYKCIKSERASIQKVAHRLHHLIFEDADKLSENDKKIKKRCCNLPLLEKVIYRYKK